jgi:hypothetical protein
LHGLHVCLELRAGRLGVSWYARGMTAHPGQIWDVGRLQHLSRNGCRAPLGLILGFGEVGWWAAGGGAGGVGTA